VTGGNDEEEVAMTRKPKLALGTVLLATGVLALPALSAAGPNTVELSAKLKGNNEVPGPGDKNGKGEIAVFAKAKKEKVCFNLELDKLDPVTAGHIHKGAGDVAGPVKVTLFEDDQGLPADPGSYDGCVKDVKKRLVKKIGKRPEKFYVNIHNPEYPDGAVRGQLGPAS
jgi:hypothetical protein